MRSRVLKSRKKPSHPKNGHKATKPSPKALESLRDELTTKLTEFKDTTPRVGTNATFPAMIRHHNQKMQDFLVDWTKRAEKAAHTSISPKIEEDDGELEAGILQDFAGRQIQAVDAILAKS